MKKKLITTILISTLLIGTLSACGNSSQDSAETMAPSAEVSEETDVQETDKTTQPAEEETDEEIGGQEEADAAYEAGFNCLYGENGKEINLEEAYTNFNHALELGKTEANFYLGILCDWYNIPEKDYEKAKAYYEAAEDDSRAQTALGLLYYNGQGVEQDVEKAQELFDAAIEQGDKGGYLGNAGIAYDKGDYTAAFENYNKVLEGAEQIFLASAIRGIGDLYGYGQGVEQDTSQALEWHHKAADLGSVSAMTIIGHNYRNSEAYTEALEWYEKAANLGSASAMYSIGDMYTDGLGVEQDYTQASEWYEKAAELGHTYAMNNIGYMYGNGIGVEQDYAQALKWYEKAANLENNLAMYNLGYMYENGIGVEQDYTQALEWYEKAADLGNTSAMYSLAGMYMDGRGVEENIDIAQEWYNKAEETK